MFGIFSGSSLSFEVDEKPAFVVPLKDVSQATTGERCAFLLALMLYYVNITL